MVWGVRSSRRSAGLITVMKAGTTITTTTTARRRCFLCGTPPALLCVMTCNPAGVDLFYIIPKKVTCKNQTLMVSSFTDVHSGALTVLHLAHMALHRHLLLFLDTTITILVYSETWTLVHRRTQDLLCPPAKRPPQEATSLQQGPDCCGSTEDNRASHQNLTHRSKTSPTRGIKSQTGLPKRCP